MALQSAVPTSPLPHWHNKLPRVDVSTFALVDMVFHKQYIG